MAKKPRSVMDDPPSKKKRRALGAYIFAGGFTVGVSRVFDVAAHLEETNYGVATVKHNRGEDFPVFYPIDTWPVAELKKGPKIDFLYGNPPCAAWSPAGSKITSVRNWRTDLRVDCTRRHFGLLEELLPTVWAWESVPQAFTTGRSFVDELTIKALDLGYSVTYLLHNAMYLGVPQKRRRFFFVAHKVKFDVAELDWDWTSCDEALRGLNDPGEPLDHNIGKYPTLIPNVKPNETLINAWSRYNPEHKRKFNARGQTVGRPCFTIKRLEAGQPAPVVMHELIHPTEHRALSIKELALLCGFPADYEFINPRDVGQISRGVCPPVGEWLARNVERCIDRGTKNKVPTVQLIDVREPPGTVTQLPRPDLTQTETTPMPRQSVVSTPIRTGTLPPLAPPDAGQGSGAYIRSLLTAGYPDDAILASVHAHFVGSKASKSDISWNKAKLRTGMPAPKIAKEKVSADVAAAHVAAKTPKYATSGTTPPWEPVKRMSLDISPDVQFKPSAPTEVRAGVDPDREFDTTSLRAGAHGQWVHRDYGAHFFRWGFAGKFISGTTDVLDVGCGPDVPMINALTMPRNNVPHSYVGVDMNKEPRNHPTRGWATLKWEFNFLKNFKTLGTFDIITNFEVIEHMSAEDGLKLLKALKACLRPDGKLLLSTPVFSGKAAKNHIHEYTAPELTTAIGKAGLKIERRFGTFANSLAIKKVAKGPELELVTKLKAYYSDEVLSCFLAPLYPDASRNNVWLLTN